MRQTRLLSRLGTGLLAMGLAFAPCPSPAQDKPVGTAQRTQVNDPAALERLRRNSGLSLQWISWDNSRGHVRLTEENGLYRLRGDQVQRGGTGQLDLDGVVLRIDATSFVFQGRIMMRQAPVSRPECLREGTFHFRVTGQRRYWRLQEMEACGGLTDYVDIYF